jgi:hypothetical protein
MTNNGDFACDCAVPHIARAWPCAKDDWPCDYYAHRAQPAVILRAARRAGLFRSRKAASAAERIEMNISAMHRTEIPDINEERVKPQCVATSYDDPTRRLIRLEVRGGNRFAVASLTEHEARELANELLKAAGSMQSF